MKNHPFLNRYTVALGAILMLQGLDTFALSPRNDEQVSEIESGFLQNIPRQLGGWTQTDQSGLDIEVQAALKPDDYTARYYRRGVDGRRAELVVAYFKSQREGFGPHSPRVCLPAAGWMPIVEAKHILSTGPKRRDEVNYFLIQKDGQHSAVLYWYQTPQRTIAGETAARMWMAIDTLAMKRSDVALVRITIPMESARDPQALQAAAEISQSVHSALRSIWQ